MSVKSIALAMVRAVESAGFINPRTETFRHADEVGVCVAADCPCGLGTSRFAILFVDSPDEGDVYAAIREQCEQHIALDKANGRWSDS